MELANKFETVKWSMSFKENNPVLTNGSFDVFVSDDVEMFEDEIFLEVLSEDPDVYDCFHEAIDEIIPSDLEDFSITFVFNNIQFEIKQVLYFSSQDYHISATDLVSNRSCSQDWDYVIDSGTVADAILDLHTEVMDLRHAGVIVSEVEYSVSNGSSNISTGNLIINEGDVENSVTHFLSLLELKLDSDFNINFTYDDVDFIISYSPSGHYKARIDSSFGGSGQYQNMNEWDVGCISRYAAKFFYDLGRQSC